MLDDNDLLEIMFACEETEFECTDWYSFVIDTCEADPNDEYCWLGALMFADDLLDENGEYIGEGVHVSEDGTELDLRQCGDISWLDTSSQQWRYASDYTEEQWDALECVIGLACADLTDEAIDENMVCWSLE